MKTNLAWWLLALVALASWSHAVHADERILDYRSTILVAADGGMTVTEHIRVRAEGQHIRRGIYRDYPTDYRDRLNNRYVVGFEVVAVQRDGYPEPWHTKRLSNGVRVYIGSPRNNVSPGVHDYTLTYRTNRELGFFDTHDELYWNVTGTGWDFPIDHASATVHLPANVPASGLKAYGYTGAQGSIEQAMLAEPIPDGARYNTTRALGRHQGMTIVLEFPKGVVRPPDLRQKLAWLFSDNHKLLVGVLGLALLWLYYGWAWNRWGRDPETGPLVARYEPPDGDSAAALRYVRRMGYDNDCLTAGLLDLAARGCLNILQRGRQSYLLTKKADAPVSSLRADNLLLFTKLFLAGPSLELKQSERQRILDIRKAHERSLSRSYEKKYFLKNTGTLLPGMLITLWPLLTLLRDEGKHAVIPLVILGILSWLLSIVIAAAMRNARGGHAVLSLANWVAVLALVGFALGGLIQLGSIVGYLNIVLFIALIGTNICFYHWMKAPTQVGARLIGGIEGFRWYLGVAEKQELDARHKPKSHPELFARYLPYAVALDVGNAWGDRFSSALNAEQMLRAQPTWYQGNGISRFHNHNLADFSANLGANVSGAIASASTAPGSSSGSSGGGGGFSGGGGGGGGGGGW